MKGKRRSVAKTQAIRAWRERQNSGYVTPLEKRPHVRALGPTQTFHACSDPSCWAVADETGYCPAHNSTGPLNSAT